MATSQEKYQLVLEAKEAAAKKIKALNKQVNDLGGSRMINAQKEVKRLERNVKLLNTSTTKGSSIFTRFTKGIAIGTLAAGAAAAAFRGLTRFLKGTFDAAKYHEKVWNDVAASLDRHRVSVDTNVKSIKEFADGMQTLSGISDELVGIAFQRLHDSNIDVAQSMELTRAAMDLSVAKGMDLVMTADLMGKSIMSTTNALSRYGIMIDKSLSKQEQMVQLQTQVNMLFGGAAAARMHTTAGKLSLMAERMGDLQEAIGKAVAQSEAFTWFLDVVSDAAKYWADLGANTNVDAIRAQIEDVSEQLDKANASMADMEKLGRASRIGAAYGDLEDTIESLNEKLIDLRYQEQILSDQALKNIMREKAERKAQLTEMFEELKGMKLPPPAFDEEETLDSANRLHEVLSSAFVDKVLIDTDILLPPPADVDEASKTLNEIIKSNINADIIASQQARFVNVFGRIGRAGVNRLSREIASGRGQISDVFSAMAEDFMTFFIGQALASIANMFIPGLGSLLGGIFDTPKHDKMAMEQGQHFAHYFNQGALAGFNNIVPDIARGATSNVPSAAPPTAFLPRSMDSSEAPGANIQVNVTGNVLTRDFVEKDIAAALKKVISDGKSGIALDPENITGERHVIID